MKIAVMDQLLGRTDKEGLFGSSAPSSKALLKPNTLIERQARRKRRRRYGLDQLADNPALDTYILLFETDLSRSPPN
ncbi:MAG: hypothetical protein SVV80_03305 [Planctomycetota bacterium]|nr:hypothetical protein [Planctomycetota bacterium]